MDNSARQTTMCFFTDDKNTQYTEREKLRLAFVLLSIVLYSPGVHIN